MAKEIKTKETQVSVEKFLDALDDEQKRDDSYAIIKLMQKITKEKPKMWGPSIVGFGTYHYKYESGHEGDMCITGFSPRKAALTLYLMPDLEKDPLMSKLGKYKTSKACLYVKRLSDIDEKVLEVLIKKSVDYVKKKFP